MKYLFTNSPIVLCLVRDRENGQLELPTETNISDIESTTDYITDVELADRIKVSRVTIQSWRQKGEGPPFYRAGRRIIYDWAEVQAWIRAQRVG